MSRPIVLNTAALACVALFAGAYPAAAEKASTKLSSTNEVPALITAGKGSFSATLKANSIVYKLVYNDLESAVSQAHIHVAQDGVNGDPVLGPRLSDGQ